MIDDELAAFFTAFSDLIKGLSNRIATLEAEAKAHGWEPPPPLPPPPPPEEAA